LLFTEKFITKINYLNEVNPQLLNDKFHNRQVIKGFPFGDTSRHKYRFVFVIYRMPRKIERLCRLVSLKLLK